MTGAQERPDGARELIGGGVKERGACHLAGLNRSSLHYASRPRNDAAVVERLRAIAQRHPRWGYGRAWAVLRREGEGANHKRRIGRPIAALETGRPLGQAPAQEAAGADGSERSLPSNPSESCLDL